MYLLEYNDLKVGGELLMLRREEAREEACEEACEEAMLDVVRAGDGRIACS